MRNRKHDIEKYLRGELSPAEMHALENAALNDPFLAEALEGADQAGRDNFLYDLHRLNRSVHYRAHKRKNKPISMWGWTAGIAATVLLVAVSGFLVVSLLKDQPAQKLSINEPAPAVQDTIRSADSLIVNEPGISQTEKAEETSSPAKQQTAKVERGVAEKQAKEAEASEEKKESSENEFLAQQDAGFEQMDVPAPSGKASKAPALTSSRSSESILISGSVTSAVDGEVLPGTNVIIKGTNVGVAADNSGRYELPIDARNSTLVFSAIGFQPMEASVEGKKELNIALERDDTSLSEVIVIPGSESADSVARKHITYRFPTPSGGRAGFTDYLAAAVKYPETALRNETEGRVTIRFTVEPNGKLANFEILREIGYGCAEELIRAIKSGPAWKPGNRGDIPVRDTVQVRFKFNLPGR